MNTTDIETFLHAAGCERISTNGVWVRSSCPLARWTHSSGSDRSPSFAIRVNAGGESRCRCLGCGFAGPLTTLAFRMNRSDLARLAVKGNMPNPADLSDEPDENDLRARVERVQGAYWGAPLTRPEEPKNEILDDAMLNEFQPMPPDVLEHLQGRGITALSIAQWEIGYHRAKRRISIPIRDENGKLVGLSGRLYKGREDIPKYLHSRFKRDLVLYGEHMVEKGGVGYLTEGFFQTIAITQAGFPGAVGRMGTHLSKWQIEKLKRFFTALVVVPDGDKPGRDSARLVQQMLQHSMPVVIAAMPDKCDADSIPHTQLMEILISATTALDAVDNQVGT